MTPLDRMYRTRTHLLLDQPWFGSLAMRLDIQPTTEFPTLATDGSRLLFNPEYTAKLTDAELKTIMAEEVLHCALLHSYRRGNREPQRYNRAADYAIYCELAKAGFTIPADSCYDPKYDGLSTETIYAQLEREEAENPPQDQPDPKEGKGEKQPGNGPSGAQGKPEPALSTGEVLDAPPTQPSAPGGAQPAPGTAHQMTAEDWKVAAEQATAVCRKAGHEPGGATAAARAARETREDWRAILREFVENTTPSDYSWAKPNRRYIAQGLYLPGMVKENLGRIAVAVDTSGSISQRVLDCFAAELTGIVHEARPEAVDVMYCDTRIRHEESFSPDDPEIVLNAHGRGGTRFSPVFNRIAERVEEGEQAPACLLYFTDLECSDRPEAPEYPVLWVTGQDVTREGPFGRTVRVDLHA